MRIEPNALIYGDNLDVLRRYIPDESVDLVYLDPPFNSNATYNVLFKDKSGQDSAAQIEAFGDTWHWDQASAATMHEVLRDGGPAAEALIAFERLLGTNDMLAYLAMMAARLVELRRVLKSTGSIYLHCDPTASHYLKVLMDAIFGVEHFGCEIVWKRSAAHSDTKQGRALPGRIHDVLLLYTKSRSWTWNPQFVGYSQEYVDRRFTHATPDGRRYKDADLTAAKPGGDTSYEWRIKRRGSDGWITDLEDEWLTPQDGWEYLGVKPPGGRYWAYSRANMRSFAEEGRIHYFSTGTPRLAQFADEMQGVSLQDMWLDIPPINSQAAERLGYPTQKPLALLERIISVSSNPGDIVLDPFCGCGTTVVAAQKLGRPWIGIDITHLSISLMRKRLTDAFGEAAQFKVYGEPTTAEDAAELAETEPYQFQWWALSLVGASPMDRKKGADKGIDGRLYFVDSADGRPKTVIISVKAGKLQAGYVRDLRGVIEREGATIGVLLSLNAPTGPMRQEAAAAGFYDSPWGSHPRLQIITVGDLLDGRRIDMPAQQQTDVTLERAPRHREGKAGQGRLEV